jgi:uncharacterized ferritin-like protein (DUF455 family)
VRNKLLSAGDLKAADIVSIILKDEVGHVYIGNYWYNWLCEQRGLDPIKPLLHWLKSIKRRGCCLYSI